MASTRANTQARGSNNNRGGSNSMLLELIDRILDKGIVIDAWARVSLLSIELLTIEARIVVASVDTYLRYAEAIGNTALASVPHPQGAQQPQQVQQASGQQAPALPQPQQQNVMPQWQAQPQQAQPQQAQPQQAQPQQAQPQQAQPQQAQPQQARPAPQQPQQPQQAQPQQQTQPPQQRS